MSRASSGRAAPMDAASKRPTSGGRTKRLDPIPDPKPRAEGTIPTPQTPPSSRHDAARLAPLASAPQPEPAPPVAPVSTLAMRREALGPMPLDPYYASVDMNTPFLLPGNEPRAAKGASQKHHHHHHHHHKKSPSKKHGHRERRRKDRHHHHRRRRPSYSSYSYSYSASYSATESGSGSGGPGARGRRGHKPASRKFHDEEMELPASYYDQFGEVRKPLVSPNATKPRGRVLKDYADDKDWAQERRNRLRRPYMLDNRSAAAVLIQRVWRGYRARMRVQGLRFVVHMARRDFSYSLVNSLIDEILEGEIIPDILIDVLANIDNFDEDDSAEGRMHRASVGVYMELLDSVLHGMVKQTVIEANNDLVNDYFFKKMEAMQDPYEAVRDEFLGGVVKELATDLVKETIDELVGEYLHENKIQQWYEEFEWEVVKPLFTPIVKEAMFEVDAENSMEAILSEEVENFILLVAEEEFVLAQGIYVRGMRASEYSTFSTLTEKIVDDLVLNRLMACLQTNCQNLVLEEYTQRLLHALMAGAMRQRFESMQESKRHVTDNVLLRKFHTDITTTMAIDFLLEELRADMPDEAEALHEREVEARRAVGVLGVTTMDEKAQRVENLRAWLAKREREG